MLVISRKDIDDITILDLTGNMARDNLLSPPRFTDVISGLLRDGRVKIIIVYQNVQYQDSTGNGEIVSAYTRARNAGGEIALVGLQGRVADLFTITKLRTVFPCFATISDAMAHFGYRKDIADGAR